MKNNFYFKEPFSNIYKLPNIHSEVTSQILYGERFKILSKRNHNPISEEILDLDKKNKDLIAQLQSLQEERNSKSKKIGELSSQGNSEEASNLKQ